jgi:hypothetical protein
VIDLSQLSTYYVLALPAIVAFLAGLIRQDKLPPLANEIISYAVVLLLSAGQALFGGKLGGSPLADFTMIAAYASTAIHTPPFAKLQQYLQSNVLSLGKPPAPPPSSSLDAIDVRALAGQIIAALPLSQLAVMLRDELVKVANSQQQQAVTPMADTPTRPVPTAVVRSSVPPLSHGG